MKIPIKMKWENAHQYYLLISLNNRQIVLIFKSRAGRDKYRTEAILEDVITATR
jgi:hypothetical protein